MANKMSVVNLAVNFAPSLFQLELSYPSVWGHCCTNKGTGHPGARESSECKAAHESLTYMICNMKSLFTMPHSMWDSGPVPMSDLAKCIGLQDW